MRCTVYSLTCVKQNKESTKLELDNVK